MGTITYQQLKTNIEHIQSIEKVKLIQKLNEHVTLYLTAIIKEDSQDSYVKEIQEQTQIELFTQGENGKTLFKGMIQNLKINVVNNIYYLEIIGISNSYAMDIKKKSRSFQDKNMTYEVLLKQIIDEYLGGDIIDKASNGSKLEKLIMQYNETDWKFLKRLASHFNAAIVPMVEHNRPKIIFGKPDGTVISDTQPLNYTVSKDISGYMRASNNTNPTIKEVDAIRFCIETNKDYKIGDQVTYQNIKLFVREKGFEVENGILRFEYVLSTAAGFSQEKIMNTHIVGVSLKGKVLDVIRDKVKVKLEIDEYQDVSTANEFTYTTIYAAEGNSGWYCMPEIEDTVMINFPSSNEADSVAMNSIRTKDKSSDKLDNPDIKYFRTKDGKELKFSEDEIVITCNNGTYIRLNENTGIEIISLEPIAFKTNKDICLQAEDSIKILAENSIRLKCKTSEIVIDHKIDICGEDVRIN
ncbi:MAG: hypothetical protein AB9856_06960 [Cellulosilyticaceae bacterium]